jgi:L-alanine-DL-glutamate epimerase-like enolase superfamily enzyme
LFVRVSNETGCHGYGCASPAEEVTGESLAACEAALRRWCDQANATGEPVGAPDSVATPAAAAAVDMALLDLEARRRGTPLYAMLGGEARALPTSITLGIGPLAETRESAHRFHRQGFSAFKVKGGRDAALDAERMLALRHDLGDDVDLRFDANEGFDEADAIRFIDRARAAGLSVVEQPVPRISGGALQRIHEHLAGLAAPRPALLADEGVLGPADALGLARAHSVDGVVIKLMKCGGIRAAREIDEISAQHGLRCMVSCMDETALAIAAALHFALAAQRCTWIDLDGHLDLIDDPSAGAIVLEDGRLRPADGPGLGVSVSPR